MFYNLKQPQVITNCRQRQRGYPQGRYVFDVTSRSRAGGFFCYVTASASAQNSNRNQIGISNFYEFQIIWNGLISDSYSSEKITYFSADWRSIDATQNELYLRAYRWNWNRSSNALVIYQLQTTTVRPSITGNCTSCIVFWWMINSGWDIQ